VPQMQQSKGWFWLRRECAFLYAIGRNALKSPELVTIAVALRTMEASIANKPQKWRNADMTG